MSDVRNSKTEPESQRRMQPKWFGRLPDADVEFETDVAERIEKVHSKTGFIPNVFLALAVRPEEFRSFFAYHDALMETEGGLSKAEREMIVVATSAANNCLYCVVAHGAVLRIRAKNPMISDQLAIDPAKATLSPRQQVMLRFAHKVSIHASDINEEDFPALYDAGFSDDDIWNIGAIASFFALSNRLAGLAKILPNDEFYGMGRAPKGDR